MRAKIILFLILLLTAILRITTFNIPFERDEGEYSYAGQLILQGIPPYSIACNMKLPGTYVAHALNMAIFGQTIAGVHAGLLIWNLAAIILIYLLGKRLFNETGGLAAAATYAWLALSPSVMGTASHATHYVVLPMLAAFLLLLKGAKSKGLAVPFGSGFLFGMAFLMKQHGIFFGIFGALYLAWENRTDIATLVKKLAVFALGAVAPFGLTCLILWRAGVFTRFWFWTFTYARAYTGQTGLRRGWENFSGNMQDIVEASPALFALAVIGLFLLWWRKETTFQAVFCTAFLGFSMAAMSPGLFFREHYFVLMLPAASLLAGAAVGLAPHWLKQPLPGVIFVAALAFSVYQQSDFFFRMTTLQQSREVWGTSPFPEALPVARYIEAHTNPKTTIAVLGSEPEIYFYSHRHSATGYVYTYSLMEVQPYAEQMQAEMITDLVNERPEYIVWVNIESSWGRREGSVRDIFKWWEGYRPEHYEVTGVADMIDDDHTEYHWDADAVNYKIKSDDYVTVLHRKR